MRMTLIAIGAALIATGGAATATPNATATATASAATAAEPTEADTKLICRVIGVTASRIGGKKVCRTREEWRQADEYTKQRLLESRDNRGNRGA